MSAMVVGRILKGKQLPNKNKKLSYGIHRAKKMSDSIFFEKKEKHKKNQDKITKAPLIKYKSK